MELTTGYCIYGTMVCMQHCSTPLYTFFKFGQSTSVLPSRTNWHVSWQYFTVQPDTTVKNAATNFQCETPLSFH